MDKAEKKAESVKNEDKCAKKKDTTEEAVKTNEKANPDTKAINPPISAEAPAITPAISDVNTVGEQSTVPPASEHPSKVVSSPTPAPIKTRRVPPGGHTTAFW